MLVNREVEVKFIIEENEIWKVLKRIRFICVILNLDDVIRVKKLFFLNWVVMGFFSS